MTTATVASTRGLTSAAAAQQLQESGPNVLPQPRKPSWVRLFLAQMTHFFAIMLWVSAIGQRTRAKISWKLNVPK